MSKRLGLVLFITVCLLELSTALECIRCKSPDLDSDCRLGHRKYKPKVDKCDAPNAKCFALAQVSLDGTANFRRGCTTYSDWCDTQTDVEFCQTCGSKFCNFWIMELAQDAEDFVRDLQEATLETMTKTKRVLVGVDKLRRRRVFDDTDKEIASGDGGSALPTGVDEDH